MQKTIQTSKSEIMKKSNIKKFEIPIALASFNETRKMHFKAYKRYRESLALLVRKAYGPIRHKPMTRVYIHFIRHGSRSLDWANLYGSFKPLEDCLVLPKQSSPNGLGIIIDDSVKHVIKLTADQKKCKRIEEKTVVFITEEGLI